MGEFRIEAVIQSVESRDVTRKRDGAKITLYEVNTDQGQFTASQRRVAEAAYAHVGEPMELIGEVVEKGDFTNYYLNKVELPFGNGRSVSSGRPQQRSQFSPPQQGHPSVPKQETVTAVPKSDGLTGYAKDLSIMRQTVIKAMVHISNTPEEFRVNCDAALYWLQHGEWPSDTPDMSGDEERQFIPAGADQGVGGGEFSDDDIPFAPSVFG